jgi:transcriptional regulator with XRE-family HTH domain
VKHHKKTTVAVLRQIIGQPISSEQSFSSMTGLSVSAIKKLSAGFLPVSMKSAEAFSKATGISADWLLKQDVNLPPVEIDNQTPYTRLSFDKHAGQSSLEIQTPSGGIAESLVSIVSSFLSAEASGQSSSAKNDLWAFSKLMAGKYHRKHQRVDRKIVEKIFGAALQVSGWDSGQASDAPHLTVENTKSEMQRLAISFDGLENFIPQITLPAGTQDKEHAEIV